MKDTLAEINALRDAGIIGQCAIGEAMGATFYLEPISTYDLDIFVIFENPPLILTLTPIYEFLNKRGHNPKGDAIVIHGWPVQFLPAESPLLTEAVQQATDVDFEGATENIVGNGVFFNAKSCPQGVFARMGSKTRRSEDALWATFLRRTSFASSPSASP